MESVPTENLETDEKGRQMIQYFLSLPTILRPILEHFSTKELIDLSLVSKLWNLEARSVMRERGNLSAKLLHGAAERDDLSRKLFTFLSDKRLEAFSSDLEKMRVVPFSGINLFMGRHRNHRQKVLNGSLEPAFKVILDRLPWKHFSVRFCMYWRDCKGCPALLLVKKILEDYCSVLEDLTLGVGNEEFFRSIFETRRMPQLKYLTIVSLHNFFSSLETSNLVKLMVSGAPNLKELHVNGTGGIDLSINVLEGSSAVLVLKSLFHPLWKPICKDLIGSIRSNSMDLRIGVEENLSSFLNTLIPQLLEASRTTLNTLVINLPFALPLMCYGICLENVTTLEIGINDIALLEAVAPSILVFVKSLDFTRIFPKLIQVTILNDSAEVEVTLAILDAFAEQGKALLRRALPDRAINIKVLKIDNYGSVEDSLPLLAQMFPDAKKVYTRREHPGCSFAELREHFGCLEEVIEQ